MRSKLDAVGVINPSSFMSWIGPSPPGRNPPALGLSTALVGWLDEGGGGTIVGGAADEFEFCRPLLFELLRPPLGLGVDLIGLAVPAEARIVPDAGRIGELAVDELLDTGPASLSSEMMFFKLERATSGSAAGAGLSAVAEFLRPPGPPGPPPRPRPPERPPRWLPLRPEPELVLTSAPSRESAVFVESCLLSLRGRGLREAAEAGLLVSLRVGAGVELSEVGLDDGLLGSLVVSGEGADMLDQR